MKNFEQFVKENIEPKPITNQFLIMKMKNQMVVSLIKS